MYTLIKDGRPQPSCQKKAIKDMGGIVWTEQAANFENIDPEKHFDNFYWFYLMNPNSVSRGEALAMYKGITECFPCENTDQV